MQNKTKIIVQISGGLGNQLFQYATGRRLALHNNADLVLDHVSGFPRDPYQRKFLLDKFNVRCGYVPLSASYATLRGRVRRRVHRALNSWLPLDQKFYIQDANSTQHDPRIVQLRVRRKCVYLDGNWQHEEYFRTIRSLLLDELSFRTAHDPINVDIAAKISASPESVCLHVRMLRAVKGEFAGGAPPAVPGSQVDPSYYGRAVASVAEKLRNPRFYVFADYPEWARENIKLPYATEYVAHNGGAKDYEDFWLMTQCKHFIIANSTFSWWAAWLSHNANKLVYAPKEGIGPAIKSVPSSWLLL